MTKLEKLTLRAKAGLSNEEEIETSLLEFALVEAEEIVGNKEIAEAFFIDIAYYRFLLLMKIDIDEGEISNYKTAIKVVENAPVIVVVDGVESESYISKVGVQSRESVI